MKVLRKTKPFYTIALNNFKKQYGDVCSLISLKLTPENKVCGGEWIDSSGQHHIADSVDAFKTVLIIQ